MWMIPHLFYPIMCFFTSLMCCVQSSERCSCCLLKVRLQPWPILLRWLWLGICSSCIAGNGSDSNSFHLLAVHFLSFCFASVDFLFVWFHAHFIFTVLSCYWFQFPFSIQFCSCRFLSFCFFLFGLSFDLVFMFILFHCIPFVSSFHFMSSHIIHFHVRFICFPTALKQQFLHAASLQQLPKKIYLCVWAQARVPLVSHLSSISSCWSQVWPHINATKWFTNNCRIRNCTL